MANREEALAELYRRGALNESQSAAVEELARRGVLDLGGAQPEPEPAEPQSEPEAPSVLENVRDTTRAVLGGATFNFADELGSITAAGAGKLAQLVGATGGDETAFWDIYRDSMANLKGEREEFAERNPKTKLAAELVGGLTSGGAGLVKSGALAAAKPLTRVAGASAVGAVEGGAFRLGANDVGDSSGVPLAAATGAVLAPVVGAAGNKVAEVIGNRRAVGQALREGSTDSIVATKRIGAGGKIETDKAAKAAISQGLSENLLPSIREASALDKRKMLNMLKVKERGMANAVYGAKNRPSDVIGGSIVDRLKVVRAANRRSGAAVNKAAEELRGQPVDFSPAVENFQDTLASMGVKLSDSGKVSFKGSDIEGLGGFESAIRQTVKKMRGDGTPDAYELHRLKKRIDEVVTYGKGKKGLGGKTERALKSLRADLNSVLQDAFPNYKAANAEYSTTIQVLDDIQGAAGKKIDMTGDNADKALGTLSRSMLSNIRSRVALTDSLADLDAVASSYKQFDDDLILQAVFVDELDKMFGAAAKTSLQGDAEKAARFGIDAARGAGASGSSAVGVVSAVANKLNGRTPERGFKAIREVLER